VDDSTKLSILGIRTRDRATEGENCLLYIRSAGRTITGRIRVRGHLFDSLDLLPYAAIRFTFKIAFDKRVYDLKARSQYDVRIRKDMTE
jgi:hypothetical protein